MDRHPADPRTAPARPADGPPASIGVCVVGPGTRFLSGITYYTYSLIRALDPDQRISAILLRRLLPRRLYPGHQRVGADLTRLALPSGVPVAKRVDWFWGPGTLEAIRLLRDQRPEILLLQWWSGAALHTYLLLAWAARRLGISLVVEFHEVLDTGEDRLGWVRRYVELLGPALWRRTAAFVVHNEHDRELIQRRFQLDPVRVAVIPHPAYDLFPRQDAPHGDDTIRLLFFGVVRPFKGLEDLVAAFNIVAGSGTGNFRLTVIGESWENWALPEEMIARSPVKQWIERVNRYVTDEEAEAAFGEADVVVLPYRRCSSSGPLHIAMGMGLPVVSTRVGGIPEATSAYPGAVLANPADPESLAQAILVAASLRGRKFEGAASWQTAAQAYSHLFRRLAPVRKEGQRRRSRTQPG